MNFILSIVAVMLAVGVTALVVINYFRSRQRLYLFLLITAVVWPGIDTGSDKLLQYCLTEIESGRMANFYPLSLIWKYGEDRTGYGIPLLEFMSSFWWFKKCVYWSLWLVIVMEFVKVIRKQQS